MVRKKTFSPAQRAAFEERTRLQLAALSDVAEDEDRLEIEREAIDEEHNETAKYVNRLLLDYAYGGTCGDPLRSEPERIKGVRVNAERAEFNDHASAEPLRDLEWILANGDSELCAQGVGAVWRSAHPFRPVIEGNPYDLLVPTDDRRLALQALDQAAALPAPHVGLGQQAAAVDDILNKYINAYTCLPGAGSHRSYPCTRATARSALTEAKALAYEHRSGSPFRRSIRVVEEWLACGEPTNSKSIEKVLQAGRDVWHAADTIQSRIDDKYMSMSPTPARSAGDDLTYKHAGQIASAIRYVAAYAITLTNPDVLPNALIDEEQLFALRERKTDWGPVAFAGTLLGGLALAFAFVSPDRGTM